MTSHDVEQKKLFFYIETEVQFNSLELLLKHLAKKKEIQLDIAVPVGDAENKEIFDETTKLIEEKGFKVNRGVSDKIRNTKYQILLSPYMYRWQYDDIQAKYLIQYVYYPYYFNKPTWNIDRLLNGEYLADAVLTHAVGTQDAIDVVSKSYIVPELRLVDFKRKTKKQGEKPTLLFLPTYNDMKFAVRFLEASAEIKKKYKIALRGHHRAVHIDENKALYKRLLDEADEVYDTQESIKTALEKADIVVSDDSSAFLEAISVRIPVALFSKNPNAFKYRDVNAIQYNLVKSGDILWTDKPEKLASVIDETLSERMIKRQEKLSDELFPDKFTDPIGRYMEVLNIYLDDKLPEEYYFMKKYWVEKIDNLVQDNYKNQDTIARLSEELAAKDVELASHLGIKRSARLLAGNIKRRIKGGNQ